MVNDSKFKELALRARLEASAADILSIVKELRQMSLVPMTYIMSRVPGETMVEKVENVGVSRQTYYYLVQGRSRPSLPQAERLSELTGIPLADIRA